MAFRFPKAIFYIGDPTSALPDKDTTGLKRLIKLSPDDAIIIIVFKEEEETALKEKLKDLQFPEGHPGALICTWKSDSELMDLICGDLHFLLEWKVIGPAHYECENGHITSCTYTDPLMECPTCKGKMNFHKMYSAECQKFSEILRDAVQLMNFDTRSGNYLHAAVHPTANVMRNCLQLESPLKHNLEDYIGKGKGKIALNLAAGPSLNRQIPHVKRLKEAYPDRFVTIGVGRAFKMLKAQGINLDYVFSCEMFGWDKVIFDGLTKEDCGDTLFCFPPVCAPDTVASWKGERLITWDANAADLMGLKHYMMGGNSIAHHMYNFAAQILKCDQVILCGQDLAYTEPDGRAHATGTDHEFPDHVKQQDRELQAPAWEPCTDNKVGPFHPDLHKMDVWLGGGFAPIGDVHVRTSPSYVCFGKLFEILIGRHKVKTWNACPNGLRIQGAPYKDLASLTGAEDLA